MVAAKLVPISVSARPQSTWLALRTTVALAKIMPTTKPTPSAPIKPKTGLGEAVTIAIAVMAPSAIRPSTPRLTTPTRSDSTSPSAASASTPPARIEVCRSPAMISIRSLYSLAVVLVVISSSSFLGRLDRDEPIMREFVADRGEEQDQSGDRQHGRGVDSLRLQDDPGIEDHRHQRRTRQHAQRRAERQHGDHDTKIAEIVGDAAL